MDESNERSNHYFPEKVLVAEDNVVVQHLLTGFLERHGFEVVGPATNGIEAIKQYMENEPAIVLMDIYMPVLDGIQATRYILNADPDAKIIMISTDSDKELVFEAMNTGALDYIVKPINTTRLLKIIKELLKSASLSQ
jgi:two-component system chemotaxis response regulator CheY